MKPGDRQKMCSNCNGRVSFEATECPYCATELTPSVTAPAFKHQYLQESLSSLYQPPYHTKTQDKENSPRKQVVFTEPEPAVTPSTQATETKHPLPDFWALFSLIVGGNLVTIGLLQFFFSENGSLQLEWDSSYWYLYCLIALPLFYLGFKNVKNEVKSST